MTKAPLIRVSRDEFRKPMVSVPERLTSKKSNYDSISTILGGARGILSSTNRNNASQLPGLRHVNSEALLQKSRFWEQKASSREAEAKKLRDRSLRETSKLRKEIDGQLIGALHAKLQVMK